jgi:hypothetical protein
MPSKLAHVRAQARRVAPLGLARIVVPGVSSFCVNAALPRDLEYRSFICPDGCGSTCGRSQCRRFSTELTLHAGCQSHRACVARSDAATAGALEEPFYFFLGENLWRANRPFRERHVLNHPRALECLEEKESQRRELFGDTDGIELANRRKGGPGTAVCAPAVTGRETF